MKYSIVSNYFIMDKCISSGAKMLYLTLTALAEEMRFIQISEKVLGEKLDVSDRTVRNGLKELCEYGLIGKYRDGFKSIQYYAVIPYEIREVVMIEDEESFNRLLDKIREYVDGNVEVDEVKKEELKKDMTSYDYCKYFADKVLEKRGQVINISDTRSLSIMKRITKNRDKEFNLRLIDLFIDVYDIKFNRKGFEVPTIQGFGTSWIYNILVDLDKRNNRNNKDEILCDEVF